LDSGTPGYVCDNYKRELQATQGVQAAGEVSAYGRAVIWLKSTAHNPDAAIRMTSVHYRVNTVGGAIIMVGVAPEQTFFTSETIFRNTAISMAVRK
jgi:hypothetical protein